MSFVVVHGTFLTFLRDHHKNLRLLKSDDFPSFYILLFPGDLLEPIRTALFDNRINPNLTASVLSTSLILEEWNIARHILENHLYIPLTSENSLQHPLFEAVRKVATICPSSLVQSITDIYGHTLFKHGLALRAYRDRNVDYFEKLFQLSSIGVVGSYENDFGDCIQAAVLNDDFDFLKYLYEHGVPFHTVFSPLADRTISAENEVELFQHFLRVTPSSFSTATPPSSPTTTSSFPPASFEFSTNCILQRFHVEAIPAYLQLTPRPLSCVKCLLRSSDGIAQSTSFGSGGKSAMNSADDGDWDGMSYFGAILHALLTSSQYDDTVLLFLYRLWDAVKRAAQRVPNERDDLREFRARIENVMSEILGCSCMTKESAAEAVLHLYSDRKRRVSSVHLYHHDAYGLESTSGTHHGLSSDQYSTLVRQQERHALDFSAILHSTKVQPSLSTAAIDCLSSSDFWIFSDISLLKLCMERRLKTVASASVVDRIISRLFHDIRIQSVHDVKNAARFYPSFIFYLDMIMRVLAVILIAIITTREYPVMAGSVSSATGTTVRHPHDHALFPGYPRLKLQPSFSYLEAYLAAYLVAEILHEVGEVMEAQPVEDEDDSEESVFDRKDIKQWAANLSKINQYSLKQATLNMAGKLVKQIRGYLSDDWNYLDVVSSLLSVLWLGLRFSTDYGQFATARVVLSLLAIPSTIGLLRFLSINRTLGELVIIIKAMFADLFVFLSVYVVMISGFGIAFQGIFADVDTFRNPSNTFLSLFSGTLSNFDFSIFDTGGDTRVTGTIGILLTIVFVVMTSILLVNLLIARMSNTFQRISDKSRVEWSYDKSLMIMHLLLIREKPVWNILPAPFNLLPILLTGFGLVDFLEERRLRHEKKLVRRSVQQRQMKTVVTSSGVHHNKVAVEEQPDNSLTSAALMDPTYWTSNVARVSYRGTMANLIFYLLCQPFSFRSDFRSFLVQHEVFSRNTVQSSPWISALSWLLMLVYVAIYWAVFPVYLVVVLYTLYTQRDGKYLREKPYVTLVTNDPLAFVYPPAM